MFITTVLMMDYEVWLKAAEVFFAEEEEEAGLQCYSLMRILSKHELQIATRSWLW
jgi:hypothetical protein